MKDSYFSVKPGAKGSEFYGGGNSQGQRDQETKYQVPSGKGLSDGTRDGLVGTTSVECPGNHPVITQLSPRNHPLLGSGGQVVTDRGEVLAERRGVLADRREVVAMMRQKCMMWKYVAMLLAVLVLSVGEMWGTDVVMELDQIRVLPTRAAFVQISGAGSTTVGSGKLKMAKSTSGTFTFTATVPDTYKIKSIAFTLNNAAESFTCTSGGTLSGSDKSWTFTPTSDTPTSSATFSMTAGSSKDVQITPTVTMTTGETITIEELKTFTYSDPNFSFTSSVATSQVTIKNKANAGASSNYINLSKSSNERSITIAAKTGYNLKFISFYYYDAASAPSATPSVTTYTASTHTWIPSSTATSVDFSFDASAAGIKIWKIYVGYEAAGGDPEPTCGSTEQAALSLSSSSGTICGTGTTTFTVSGGSGTGELSVSSSDETKATASIDGLTVTVTGVAAGSATITVTKACDATYAEKTATYAATVAAVPTAAAGVDKTTELGEDVALAATAAASGCTGAWTIVSGPNTATSQLSSTSSATATFTPTVAGTYTLRWTVTNSTSGCSAYDDMTVTAAVCSISDCGNATLTYAINASTSVTNTAANLISSATASNTTAMGINGTAALSTITIGSSDNAGKAAAATSTCYPTKPTMSSKIGMYNGASYSSSNYLQFAFTVNSGYTFTPCDIQFTVQPVSSAGNFRWEITDGTSSYGYGVATDVPKGSDGGASVLTGLGSTAEMEAGTYYIRLYPYDNESNTFRISNNVILKGTTAVVACTAPNHVDITPTTEDGNYGWRYTTGETLKLTATAYSSADTGSPISSGITSYQWQKYVDSDWEDLSDGGTISGATTANLQISNLTSSDGGSYRCEISTGATCTTESDGYWVRIFTLNGNYYGEEWTENPIVWTGENTGVATVSLNASSTYMFKVTDNDGKWFGSGSGNYIIEGGDSKDCGTGNNDIRLFTGPAGKYTFTVDITNAAAVSPYVNVVTGYPEVSHPATGYMYVSKWWDCYPHWWDGSDNGLTSDGSDPEITKYTTICGNDYWYMPVLDNYTNIAVKDNATWSSASNNSGNQSTTGHSGWLLTNNGSWVWQEFTTYTVTAAASDADYGTVSPASVTGVACGTSISTSSNTLSVGATNVTATPAAATAEYTYAFDHWAWTPAGATVTSDVTATATFTRTPKSYTLTWVTDGDALTGTYTSGSVAYGTPITQPDTPTKTGYTFAGWSSDVASTMPAANTTYTATWTANSYTISYYDGGATDNITFSGEHMPSKPTSHTYGTATTLKKASKSGYVFGGWYGNYSCSGDPITSYGATDITSDQKLYAKWTAMNLTPLANGTLYTASDMVPDGIEVTSTTQYWPGVSTNNIFNLLGTGSGTSGSKGTSMGSSTCTKKTIDGTDFTKALYFKTTSSLDGSSMPTTRTIQFKISEEGLLDIYCYKPTKIYLIKSGGSAVQLDASDTDEAKITKTVSAGTYYLYGTEDGTENKLYGLKFTPTLTAISADRLYQAAEMANITFTGKDQNFTGLSTNNLFKVYGDATDDTKTAAKGKNEDHNVTDDISTKSFTSALYILSNSNTTSTSDPTEGAIEIITPSTPGILYLYLDANNSALTLKKQGTSTSTSLSGAAYKAMPVDANTHYFINGSSTGKRGLYGIQYVSTYAVSITPTNVTKATGETGAGVAVKGKAYTATFTANTGYTLPDNVTVSIGGTPATKGTEYTWSVSDGTGTLTVKAANVTGAIAVTVSGVAAATYTVTYNGSSADGGTVPTDGNSYTSGSTVTVLGNTGELTRIMDDAEATFLGWNTNIDTYSGTHYNAGDAFSITSNMTLYAVWGYALEYNTDGGTINDVSYPSYYVSIYPNSGETTTLPSDVTKTGYTFEGWKTGNGSGTIVTTIDGEYTGSFSGDYALKAIWTPKTTTITLDKNGGDTNGSATATYDSKALTITHATRTGYTLKGYRTASSGGDMIIKSDGTLDGTHPGYTSSKTWAYDGETLTLYAQWEANKYNVTHTLSNVSRLSGDGAGSKKATYGTEYSVVFEAESGYALPVAVTVTVGGSDVTANCTWNQGTGELTIPAADVTGDIVITVTGVLTCTDPGLGFESASLTKYTGESVSNTLTNTHNVEVSYSSSNEAVATVNSSTGAVTIKGVGTTTIAATAAAQTVSAVSYCADAASYTLEVNPYTITYNLNEGAWGGVSPKATYTKFDEGYDLPTPTKTDYTFLGWYENSSFTGGRVYILPAGSTGDKTYYAKWGSAVTATWTITDYEDGDDAFYKGGSGHHVKAVLDQDAWDASGSAGDLDLSASEGVTLSSVTKDVYTSGDNNGKAYVEADFSISGDIDEDAISFFLNVPAAGGYAAAELSKELTLNECPGGSSDVYVVGYTNSTGTGTGSASNKCLLVEDTWYTSTSPSFTDKTSTDGFTITCNNASSYYWVQGTPGFSGTSTGATMKALKIGSGNDCTIKWTNDELAFSKMKIVGRNTSDKGATTLTVSNDGGTTTKTFTFEKGTTPQSQEVEMLFSSGETKGISITGGDKEINVLLELTPVASGASGVPTTLSWSGSLADGTTVDKRDVDADFTYTATPSTNTIGAITYTSSDESVATVDGNGKVHIINEGPTTITATLAESGCYTGDEITYELNVESTCADVPGTIVAADGSAIAGNSIEKGACETVTLKLTGYTDGASIQWKKDGANISGARSAEYTVPTDGAGVYTAVTTNTCDLTSANSVTVTSASSTIAPTIFADEFTVKSDRPFEYRLMQLNEGETCTFESATNWTNDDDFKITTEGNIVTIKGIKRIDSDANETIRLKISNGCSDDIYKDILIHAITESFYATPESTKPMIAWIATGDKGVKDNVLADQSTNTDLYKALVAKNKYSLTPRNCYWTTDEKELIKEYSQYDLVILTDYPNSRKGPNSEDDRSKSYTNALGLLIDRVPMLTFEAFVAGCPNWGLSSNPENTSSTQNSLTLLCNANDIFGTSDAFNAGASVAVGTAAEGQALQGFELDAMPNFVFIAKITDGGTDYVTCCERQVNTNARMMVFGLNQNLMNAITETGEDMVAGFVDYLLLDETASIPDCSVIFKGTGGTDWSNTDNWEGASLPNPYASVRIDAPCVVGDGETAKAGMIKIHTGSDTKHTYTGSLTIQPQGRMIVENGVYKVEGTNYATYLPTEPNNLVINADEDHTGALIFSNPRGNTQATVYLYSKATTSENTCWQYVGIPFGSLSPAVSWFYNAWMMKYTTGTTTGDNVLYSWEYINNYDVLNGFQGYALTQTAAKSYQLQGGLAPTTDKVLAVSNAGGNGWNLYANSWTAPIHIDKMEASDFVNADATIYLYNTGSRADWKDLTLDEAGTSTTAGQYLAVPVGLAEYTGTKYIPSMQGFFVQGNHASAAGSVRLRYDAVVRDTTVMADLNTPLRTPSRETVNQEPEHVTMVVRGEKYTDVLHLFRSDEWSAGYENGYDAHKVDGDDYTPQLYAVTGKEELAVVATDEWEGTVLNFRAGSEDGEYTIFFRYNESEAEALYLYDLTTQTYTRIENGGSYHFSTTDKETHPRFILTYNAPSVATGTGDVQRDDVQSTKARKVLLDNHVYIFRNGKLYDSTGKMVK